MSIDLHEPAAATRTAAKHARKTAKKTAKRARTRAFDTVDAARAIEIHVPDQAKQVAKRAAKKAAKQATAAAGRAAHRKTRKTGRRVARFTFGALAIGGLVALGFVVARKMRTAPPPPYLLGEDTDGAAGLHEPRAADVAP